jgi:hypothetical protein
MKSHDAGEGILADQATRHLELERRFGAAAPRREISDDERRCAAVADRLLASGASGVPTAAAAAAGGLPPSATAVAMARIREPMVTAAELKRRSEGR